MIHKLIEDTKDISIRSLFTRWEEFSNNKCIPLNIWNDYWALEKRKKMKKQSSGKRINSYSRKSRKDILLKTFREKPYYAFSRDDLLDILWDTWELNDRTIDSKIKRLRTNLAPDEAIHSLNGRWYFFAKWEFVLKESWECTEIINWIYYINDLWAIYSNWILHMLSRSQLVIFEILFNNKNIVFSRENLLEKEGVSLSSNPNIIDTIIRRIRWLLKGISRGLEKKIVSERWIWYVWRD